MLAANIPKSEGYSKLMRRGSSRATHWNAYRDWRTAPPTVSSWTEKSGSSTVSGRSSTVPRYHPETQPLALPATPFYAHTSPSAHILVPPASIDKMKVWKLPSGEVFPGGQVSLRFSLAQHSLVPNLEISGPVDPCFISMLMKSNCLARCPVCPRDGPSILESSKALIIFSPCPTSL